MITWERASLKKGWFYFTILLLLAIIAITPCYAQSKIWKISQFKSRIQFSIKYLLLGKIKGEFQEYDATLISEKPDFSDAVVDIIIYTNSIETGNKKRDSDLKSESLFYVSKYPEMSFHGKKVDLVKEGIYKISGDLSIRAITRSVVLEAIRLGESVAEDGIESTKWQLTTSFKRSDFGLKLSRLKELFADDKVRIDIEAEFFIQNSDSLQRINNITWPASYGTN